VRKLFSDPARMSARGARGGVSLGVSGPIYRGGSVACSGVGVDALDQFPSPRPGAPISFPVQIKLDGLPPSAWQCARSNIPHRSVAAPQRLRCRGNQSPRPPATLATVSHRGHEGVGDPARRSATHTGRPCDGVTPVSLATCATEYPCRRTSAATVDVVNTGVDIVVRGH
jgi:hypothetical protein